MPPRLPFLAIAGALVGSLVCSSIVSDAAATFGPAEKSLFAAAIYPLERQSTSPTGGQQAGINPPPLLWPRAKGATRYDVRLSQDPTFRNGVIRSSGQSWAMFNPHSRLAPGTWFWQYAVAGGTSPEGPRWSATNEFRIAGDTPVFESPTATELLAAVPASHPRLLVTADRLDAFRRNPRLLERTATLISAARPYVGRALPTEAGATPKRAGKSAMQVEKLSSDASKALGRQMNDAVSRLAAAYLATGDEQFGREAVRWALRVASWDRAGPSGRNNFGDMYCLDAMVRAYDAAYGLLTEPERQALRRGIRSRAGHFVDGWTNRLETQLTSEHAWQHILLSTAEAGVATAGELPEAGEWLTYAYELWLARAPTEGGPDGGWMVGVGYFGVATDSLIGMPSLLKRLSGVDFFRAPFYAGSVDYLLYDLPPNSFSDGFGDDHERVFGPRASQLRYARTLAAGLANPYASWYAIHGAEGRGAATGGRRAARAGGTDDDEATEAELTWNDLGSIGEGTLPPPVDHLSLPQAHAFRETGIVAMHTDLADVARDLFVSFRSSPWGSFGHAHADQNTFNIVVGGQRLFYSSGYKVSDRDPHVLGWYKHTRGHNGVLIDGTGQAYGTSAYGWIPRYLHGDLITYCVGDASHAYRAGSSAAAAGTDGARAAGLTRFRRHVLLLRPSTVVVYDELTADHPAEWSWLLHSMEALRTVSGQQAILGSAGAARSRVDLAASVPLSLDVTSHFSVPAENWRGTVKNGKTLTYPDDQWHLAGTSTTRTSAMRFLAIIRIGTDANESALGDLPPARGGWIRTDGWEIRAELDRSRAPLLEVRSLDGAAALVSAGDRIAAGGHEYRAAVPGSALLVEPAAHGAAAAVFEQAVDELPLAARAK